MHSATLEILKHASASTWGILFVMALISVGLWSILIRKATANRRQALAWDRWQASLKGPLDFSAVLAVANRYPATPMGRVALSAFAERGEAPLAWTEALLDRRENLVREAVERTADREAVGNERGVVFLAFCSATGPLIGLLGTVWGIMDAFFRIGQQGSANITVVAPGIAEALVATMAGLLVAIPASVGYNAFTGFNREADSRLSGFASELLCLFRRGDMGLIEGAPLAARQA